MSLEGDIRPSSTPKKDSSGYVYIFDQTTSSVKRRKIIIAGIRENSLIVIEGLKHGDRVASAGVSFLRDGQKVKLLPDTKAE